MTEAELLDAIDANPDDDAPRLAHADWLEENGEPDRAEFIRLQVGVAAGMPSPGRFAANGRVRELLLRHEARWLEGRPRFVGTQWEFRRGHAEELTVQRVDEFARHATEVFAWPVRTVVVRGTGTLEGLAARPGFARVRRLQLNLALAGEGELAGLLGSPHLCGLHTLEVFSDLAGAAGLAMIASCRGLSRLRALRVHRGSDAVLDVADIAGWDEAPGLARLRVLGFLRVKFTPKAARQFLASSLPRRLEDLRLNSAGLRPDALAGLHQTPAPTLAELHLAYNRLGDDGAEAVARAPLGGLRGLDLSANLIGERGTRALAGSAVLAGLRRLDLGHNVIPDAGAEALARSPHLGALERLAVVNNLVGDDGMLALGRSPTFSLREFLAWSNPARPEVVAAVAEALCRRAPLQVPPPPPPASRPPPARVVGAPEEDGLVRSILADPRDELACAAYADWLEEQGKPLHAELVRLPADGPQCGPLLARIGEALQGWCLEASRAPGGLLLVAVQLKDFIGGAFATAAPAWLRGHHVAVVRIVGETKDWARVGDAQALAHVRALSLVGCPLGDEGARQLARAEGTAGLVALALGGTRIAEPGIVALAGPGGPGGLERLDVPFLRPGTEGVRAIAEGPMGQGLRNLFAPGTHLGAADVALLARGMPRLVSLDLSASSLPDQAAIALATAPGLPALRNLDLGRNWIGDAGAAALLASPLAARLRLLRLTANRLSEDGWLAAARAAASLPGLTLCASATGPAEAMRDILGGRLILE